MLRPENIWHNLLGVYHKSSVTSLGDFTSWISGKTGIFLTRVNGSVGSVPNLSEIFAYGTAGVSYNAIAVDHINHHFYFWDQNLSDFRMIV